MMQYDRMTLGKKSPEPGFYRKPFVLAMCWTTMAPADSVRILAFSPLSIITINNCIFM